MTETCDIPLANLSAYLESNLEGFDGPVDAQRFSGGQSNPTYLIYAESGKYVLRRKPFGKLLKSAHAIDREYKVMSALAKTDVQTPRMYHLCRDESVIGSMFYLMEYVDGRVFWDPALPELLPAERRKIFNEMSKALAEIHRVDALKVGLSDFGRPGNYIIRQTERWSNQYRASETEQIPAMEKLMRWLPGNMPDSDGRISLVHGDFRLDNIMFHKDSPSILAVVDWEISTLGNPFADLSYQCMQLRMPHNGVMPGLSGLDRSALGIPTEEEYVADYCRNAGISEIPDWRFYLVFSFFKLAAVCQGIKKRRLDGTASSDKAQQMGDLVKPLAEMAVELC